MALRQLKCKENINHSSVCLTVSTTLRINQLKSPDAPECCREMCRKQTLRRRAARRCLTTCEKSRKVELVVVEEVAADANVEPAAVTTGGITDSAPVGKKLCLVCRVWNCLSDRHTTAAQHKPESKIQIWCLSFTFSSFWSLVLLFGTSGTCDQTLRFSSSDLNLCGRFKSSLAGWTVTTWTRFLSLTYIYVSVPPPPQCLQLVWPGWFAPGPTRPLASAPQMESGAAVPPTRCQRAPTAPAPNTQQHRPLRWRRRTGPDVCSSLLLCCSSSPPQTRCSPELSSFQDAVRSFRFSREHFSQIESPSCRDECCLQRSGSSVWCWFVLSLPPPQSDAVAVVTCRCNCTWSSASSYLFTVVFVQSGQILTSLPSVWSWSFFIIFVSAGDGGDRVVDTELVSEINLFHTCNFKGIL